MTGALAALLVTLDHRFEAWIGVGASLSLVAMALFLIQVVTEAARPAARTGAPRHLRAVEHG